MRKMLKKQSNLHQIAIQLINFYGQETREVQFIGEFLARECPEMRYVEKINWQVFW